MRLSLERVLIVAVLAASGVCAMGDPAAAAQLSTLALQRSVAADTFGLRLGELSGVRARIADDYNNYERGCRGKITIGQATGIAVIPPDVAMWISQRLEIENESTPACRMLVAGIKSQTTHLRRELERIDEDARRRGVYPGVMRDLKRGYGFE